MPRRSGAVSYSGLLGRERPDRMVRSKVVVYVLTGLTFAYIIGVINLFLE